MKKAKINARMLEQALLEHVVRLLQPIIRVVSSHPILDGQRSGPDATWDYGERYHERALMIIDGRTMPTTSCDRQEGNFDGFTICLAESGAWLEIREAGTWSHRDGEPSRCTRKVRVIPTSVVLARWQFDVIVAELFDAIAAQINRLRDRPDLAMRIEEIRTALHHAQ